MDILFFYVLMRVGVNKIKIKLKFLFFYISSKDDYSVWLFLKTGRSLFMKAFRGVYQEMEVNSLVGMVKISV